MNAIARSIAAWRDRPGRVRAAAGGPACGGTFLRATWFAAALLFVATPAEAETLRMDLASQPVTPAAELVLRGENRGSATARVVLRVDDMPSPPYANRANVERLVPPGPFVLRLRLARLATPRGRVLDRTTLRRAHADGMDDSIRLQSLALDTPPALPDGVRGWAFGPEGTEPFAGMESVAPGDPRLTGPGPRYQRRPVEDPILAGGVSGATRFSTALPPGRWRVTLYTEDAGEWETLPHVLEQRIRINGVDAHRVRQTAPAWVAARYFAGRDEEAAPAAPPFRSIAARRGGMVEGFVTVGAAGLVLEMAGHPRAATHVAALFAEPVEAEPRAAAAVDALRAARFAESWPVLSAPAAQARAPLRVVAATPRIIAARGGIALLRFTLPPGEGTVVPRVTWDGGALPARLHWAQWRWRRPTPETPGLVLEDTVWRGDMAALRRHPSLPRRLLLAVQVPDEAAPGTRRVRLDVGRGVSATAEVTVLPIRRPPPAARVGVFLDYAPHLENFPETRDDARRQAACDMATLRGLGLETLAPPLATPDPARLDSFLADLRRSTAGAEGPVFAYASLRRLARQAGNPESAAETLRAVEEARRAAGLPGVIWTAADEPTGLGNAPQVRALAAAIGNAAPLAGFLNDPRDAALLPLFAAAAVNTRYGADESDMAAIHAAGPVPWLYNMPALRRAAGFHLWRVGAAGLIQWHARMPTADAFDPTDGREGDVQFLWPTPEVCGAPDLDEDLLELAEGAEDLRWLAWLDARAARDPEAAALSRSLRGRVPPRWRDSHPASPELRNAILELARRTQGE